MEHSRSRIVVDGAVAGIIGGVVVAAWFLIFDLIRGHALETPALLAALILHGGGAAVAERNIVTYALEYSVLHFAAFVAVGVAGGVLLEAAEREHALIFSLLIFFVGFEAFFIAVVLFLGHGAMAALPIWGVIAGNLLATVAMLAYFLGRHPLLARHLFGGWIGIAREGIAAGLVGAIAVAIWFMCYDLLSGHLFRTPTLLGAMIFQGGIAAGGAQAAAPLAVGYTILHFLAFAAFGLALAGLLAAAEREPFMALLALLLLAVFEVFFVGFVSLVDQSALETLGWWKIIAGNILALVAMAAYFLARHPGLHLRLVERWATLDGDGGEMGEAPARDSHPNRATPQS
ncbi:MAG TPA: hypothetical protein VMT58_03235 [Candidatus Binataceae bacterium]|nr:hypothetical protein [Candidatus Binataceae bacterium]